MAQACLSLVKDRKSRAIYPKIKPIFAISPLGQSGFGAAAPK